MTKIIAISRTGKRTQVFSSVSKAIQELNIKEKDVYDALKNGTFVVNKKTGASWYLDELYEGK